MPSAGVGRQANIETGHTVSKALVSEGFSKELCFKATEKEEWRFQPGSGLAGRNSLCEDVDCQISVGERAAHCHEEIKGIWAIAAAFLEGLCGLDFIM